MTDKTCKSRQHHRWRKEKDKPGHEKCADCNRRRKLLTRQGIPPKYTYE